MGGTPAHIMAPRIILLLSVFALMLIGFVMIYSTSAVNTLAKAGVDAAVDPMGETLNQIKFAVVGVILAVLIWKFVPVTLWRSNAVWIVWALAFALLVITALFGVGDEDWGARRWLMIGSSSLQASEFAKIALVLVAARLLTDWREGRYTVMVFFVLIGLLVLAPVLVILGPQSDLGTAMICVVGILAVMWLGEVPLRTMLIVIGVVVALGLVGIFGSSYRRDRLMVFMDPWNDGEGGFGTGYQLIHSLYAFAGGGFFGLGLGNSHEKYQYLTQSDTDFIFAIIGEELGLVGAAVVIILFLLFLYAGTRIAQSAPDNFGTMVAGGCTIMIAFQAFLNIAMVIGWFPVVGKPLPFISSGGSSLVAMLIMVGIILSVSRGAEAPSIYDRRRADLRVVRATNEAPAPQRGRRPSSGRGRR
ncbi:FtsW/RodA/SpoVE family cell cycle protein [Eggerthella sinensis]|nr:putative peptidoglycan glycosyltransferase FtsW [Eggerthella sinensis]MCB7037335.1 putative lipid II flippase FtsW [Eggerthella sinensis]